MDSINGHCFICGDNVTVYQIIPESRWTMKKIDEKAMGNWVFEELEPGIKDIAGGFKNLNYSIIIAGKDFGCGSKSVEHPIAALKGAGIKLIIAESFSRYTYRNAINLALPVIICPDILNHIDRNDELAVDLITGRIENKTSGKTILAEGISPFALDIISGGGLLRYIIDRKKEVG